MKDTRIELEKQPVSNEIEYEFRDPYYFKRAELRACSVPAETARKAFMIDCDQDSVDDSEPEPEPEKRTLSVNTIMWLLSLALGMTYVIYQYVYPLLVINNLK